MPYSERMAFRYTNLGTTIAQNPQAAVDELIELLMAHDGNQSKAAAAIDVDYRTFTRWLARLQAAGHDVRAIVNDRIDERRRAADVGVPPGPRKKSR